MSEFVIQLVKSKKGAQAVGVLLMGLGVFLVISLISHSALDYPNSSRLAAESFNWGGQIGAYVSYGVFASMGQAAYVWPLLILFWGWNRLRYQPLAHAAYRSIGLLGMAIDGTWYVTVATVLTRGDGVSKLRAQARRIDAAMGVLMFVFAGLLYSGYL